MKPLHAYELGTALHRAATAATATMRAQSALTAESLIKDLRRADEERRAKLERDRDYDLAEVRLRYAIAIKLGEDPRFIRTQEGPHGQPQALVDGVVLVFSNNALYAPGVDRWVNSLEDFGRLLEALNPDDAGESEAAS